ncbi:response regulator [Primorskyibacter flagellatus]|uniref:PAS domain-containing hybrid sensor histidine kinase/response regulator n=1 Tax=Primorskyibacter flagellatus TaxID=1387277 RepID=UPI003A9143C4
MSQPVLHTERQLAAFDARNSPTGLLARYARGRVSHFVTRHWLTLSGAATLVVLSDWRIGLLAIFLALMGEAVDCLYLRKLPDRLVDKSAYELAYRRSSVTAGFQAVTIASCVTLADFAAPPGQASLVALSYLTGAAINAGMVYPFHPGAAKVRLTVYALTLLGHFAIDIARMGGWVPRHGYDILAAIMLLYTVRSYIGFIVAGHDREASHSRALLLGKLAEERVGHDLAFKEREASQLSLVARHANDSVILSDADSRVLWVNEAFTRITGYTLEDAVGKTPADVLNAPDTDPDTCQRIAQARAAGLPCREEVLNATKDGRLIWVEANIVPVLNAEGGVETIVAIERDITAAKEQERLLAEAKLAAEDGARAKANFLATMSHEIRTPMNGIIGMAELLAETSMSKDQKLFAETIRSSAASLLKIVNDVLDFSRLDADRMSICAEQFSLATCIREATDLLRVQAREKGLFLDICHDVPLPQTVLGDRGRVRQILVNLLGNALKFTSKGGVTIRTSWETVENRILLTVNVTDTGIGVDPANADHIFGQFAQADAATTRRFGGTGLGLSISRLLARRMGGDLVLSPRPPPGAQFDLTLLLDHADDTAVTAPLQDITTIHPGMRLLVAEDNGTNRLLIQKYLLHQPIDLRFANDGVQAVNLVRETMPDVILMDMSMPEMDGLAATREIRMIGGVQPHIIALTANAFESDREACFEAGMDDFLAKPLRKAQLFQALSRASKP